MGLWISDGIIVPDPSNPQSFTRYSYVLANPLRYSDSTGYFSEDEIMGAFGVKTWEEVITFFEQDGALEGRWGWLEALRQAVTGDALFAGDSSRRLLDLGRREVADCELMIGTGNTHIGMSEVGSEYRYYSLRRRSLGAHFEPFATFVNLRTFHRKMDWFEVDWLGIGLDGAGIVLDVFVMGAGRIPNATKLIRAGNDVAQVVSTLHVSYSAAQVLDLIVNGDPMTGFDAGAIGTDVLPVATDVAGLAGIPVLPDAAGSFLALWGATYETS